MRPVAGVFAEDIFAIGLLASSILALPVLSATTAYVVVNTFGGEGSIEDPIKRDSLPFYSIILAGLASGTALSYFGIEPIHMLFLAGIVGGIGAPVLLCLLLRIAGDKDEMAAYRVEGVLRAIGWLTAAVVSLASIGYVVFQVLPYVGTG